MEVENKLLPVPVLLFCPNCFEQHVDEACPDVCEGCGHPKAAHMKGDLKCWIGEHCPCEGFIAWLNPPHKSHRCNFCNHVWRPADVPTEGVQSLTSKGERDGSPRPVAFANGKDFNEAVAIARAQQDPDPDLIERAREFCWSQGVSLITDNGFNVPHLLADFAHSANDAWVPVEERLPTFDSDVLITYLSEPTKAPLVGEGFFNTYEQRWHHRNSGWTPDVIAWLPLPPPYSGKGGTR